MLKDEVNEDCFVNSYFVLFSLQVFDDGYHKPRKPGRLTNI